MGQFIDLTGKRFGKLTAMEYLGKNDRMESIWGCLCDCGNKATCTTSNLNSGNSSSCGCNRNAENIIGKKFNRLLVIKRVEDNPYGFSQWLCKCDCGNKKIVIGASLKSGHTKSCGCARDKGVKIGVASFNAIYNSYTQRAKKGNIDFNLSKEQFKHIIDRNCFYCGEKPKQIKKSPSGRGDYTYNGIDRLDSLKGYTLDNVVTCCWRCNEAKMTTPQEEFISWIDRVYNHLHRED